MARISTYDKDVSLSGKDKVVGSNYVSTINSVDQYTTTNFTLEALAEYFAGQITTDPVQLSLKSQGGLVIEVVNNTNFLAVNLDHTNITGTLANTDLENSSITINGTAVSLGGSISVPVGDITAVTAGTYLNGGGTTGDVTVNHDDTTRTNSTSAASPAYGATFTAIDTLTTNATGHVTAVNTKTVTLPSTDNTTYDLDLAQSTNDVDLTLDASTGTDTTIKFKAGSNITLTKGAVGGVEQIAIASQAFGTVFTVATQSAMISATSTGGDIVIRTDVSKTFIHNGGSAGDVNDFSELQFSGINSIALTAGDGIDLSRTTLTNTNNDLTVTNSLATTSERGGIKIGYTESGKNYPVELDSEKAFVNVPWANTNQLTEWVLTDDDDDNTTIDHGKHVKFVMATGALSTNTTGAGTDADPYLVTLTSPDSNTTYTAGNGLDLTGTEFSHTDTSSQASVDNSGRTYIQDITLDTYGHVTGLVSATETVVDTNTNQLTTWDLLDDDDDSFTIDHDKHVKFTSGTGAYGTNITGTGTSSDPYVVAITSPNDTVPNTFRTVKVDTNDDGTANETIGATEDLKLVGGTNVTLAEADGKVTITSSDSDTTNWNFKVDSGTATNIAAGNTLTFTGGDRITLAQTGKTIDIAGDILTLTDLNTVTSAMTGDNTLTFGDADNDTSIVIRGNLQVVGTTTTNNVETVSTSNGIIFEGTTANDHESILLAGALTADRVVTIPDATFTIPTENTQLSKETVQDYVSEMFAGNTETRIAVTYDDNNNKVNFVVDDMTDNTNYYLDGISKSGNVLTFSVNGATNQTYTFGSNAFNSTTIPTNNNQITNGAGYTTNTGTTTADNTQTFTNKSGNISQWTNDSNYLTSFSETDTLATVTGRAASTATASTFSGGLTSSGLFTSSGTGAAAYAHFMGNAATTSPATSFTHGLAMAWNNSGGSREFEHWWATGADIKDGSQVIDGVNLTGDALGQTRNRISYISWFNRYNPTGDSIVDTRMAKWYGSGEFELLSMSTLPGGGATPTFSTPYIRLPLAAGSSGQILARKSGSTRDTEWITSPTTGVTSVATGNGLSGGTITSTGTLTLSGSYTGNFGLTGTFTASGDVIAFSDKALKENIQTIENALEKVTKLRGVEFNKIGENKKSIGVIAQEIEKILPEVVNNEGEYKGVAYGNITGVLIEAIKELREEVKQLKTCNCNGGNG